VGGATGAETIVVRALTGASTVESSPPSRPPPPPAGAVRPPAIGCAKAVATAGTAAATLAAVGMTAIVPPALGTVLLSRERT
jgi:hypothetical protein